MRRLSLRESPVVIARRHEVPTWQSTVLSYERRSPSPPREGLPAQPAGGVAAVAICVTPGSMRRKSDPSVGEGLAPPACSRNQGSRSVVKWYISPINQPLRGRSVSGGASPSPTGGGRRCAASNQLPRLRGCGYSLPRLRRQLPQRGRDSLCRASLGTVDCHVGAIAPPRNDSPRTFAPRNDRRERRQAFCGKRFY